MCSVFIIFTVIKLVYLFLGSSKRLYKRLRPSVGCLVGPFVGPHIAYVEIASPEESSRLVWVTLVYFCF
jgi:hypothetical protein